MAEEKTNVYNRAELSKTTAFKKQAGTAQNTPEPSYYVEYKDDSTYHRRGETQLIKADEAFIGREAKCLIRFDTEHFPTVSREHAVIVREGTNFKLLHRSQTNATLVNGTPIGQSFYLQDGDEIQFSEGGPRVAFMLTDRSKAVGGSTGGRKLRSYKTLTIVLAAIILAAVGGFLAYKYLSGATRSLDKLSADVYTVQMKSFTLMSDAINNGQPFTYTFDIYGDTAVPTASGYMTAGNRFVTSHSVIEPWYYQDCSSNFSIEDPIAYANLVLTKFNGHITATFEAKSEDGKILEFTSKDCAVTPAQLQEVFLPAQAGQYRGMPVKAATSSNDFVYLQRDMPSNIAVDNTALGGLSVGSDLYLIGIVAGEQLSIDGTPVNVTKPISQKVTIQEGDQMGNPIELKSTAGLLPGSPVFCKKRGQYCLVGTLVSFPGSEKMTIIPFSE